MKECHIAVKPNKNSKQQALETIGKLKETLPIERAQMRMKVSTPVRFNNKIRKQLGKLGAACTVESEEKVEETMVLVLLVDPGTRLFSPEPGSYLAIANTRSMNGLTNPRPIRAVQDHR